MDANRCEVQGFDGKVCGQPGVCLWDYGGPGLRMCKTHDDEMSRHVAGCRHCRGRLTRREPVPSAVR